jgi:hypothetical protein
LAQHFLIVSLSLPLLAEIHTNCNHGAHGRARKAASPTIIRSTISVYFGLISSFIIRLPIASFGPLATDPDAHVSNDVSEFYPKPQSQSFINLCHAFGAVRCSPVYPGVQSTTMPTLMP